MATTAASKNVQHLVVDSGAFLRNAPLKDLAEEIFTVTGVVEEIRDKATRERLQVLPYELRMKEPSPECIHAVSEFAKKTGDYRVLSSVDLRVLGLVYQLHKQHIGLDDIRTEPVSKVTMVGSTVISSIGAVNKNSTGEPSTEAQSDKSELKEDLPSAQQLEASAADQLASASDVRNICSELEQTSLSDVNTSAGDTKSSVKDSEVPTNNSQSNESQAGDDTRSGDDTQDCTDTNKVSSDDEEEEDDDDDEEGDDGDDESDDEEDDDGGDWITPQNYSSVRQTLNDQMNKCEKAEVMVACLTTDFAMQNVLLQMGLHLISVDGLMIRRTNNYVLRCTACFKVTAEMRREFCHHCGNRTLRRVATSVDADGTVRYHISQRKKLSTRGLRYNLPTPKGGKRACNPILCEDQLPSQSQKSSAKYKTKYEVLGEDYTAYSSPFAPIDVNSRSAIHRFTAGPKGRSGGRGGRKNPNENAKVYGRRK